MSTLLFADTFLVQFTGPHGVLICLTVFGMSAVQILVPQISFSRVFFGSTFTMATLVLRQLLRHGKGVKQGPKCLVPEPYERGIRRGGVRNTLK